MGHSAGEGGRARLVRELTALLAGAEAGGLLTVAAVQVVLASEPAAAAPVAAFFALSAVALGWCAIGLHRCQTWSRGPLLVTQLLVLAIACTLRETQLLAGAVLALVAVGVLTGVLTASPVRDPSN